MICKVPQSSSEFQTHIQPQRPETFFNASQRRVPIGRLIYIYFFKLDIEYPFEHGEVINYTLDGVSIHPVKNTGVLPYSVAREQGTHSGTSDQR
jgi:hypothetical protein